MAQNTDTLSVDQAVARNSMRMLRTRVEWSARIARGGQGGGSKVRARINVDSRGATARARSLKVMSYTVFGGCWYHKALQGVHQEDEGVGTWLHRGGKRRLLIIASLRT